MAKDVNGFLLDQQRKSSGDIAQEWNTLEELYNKKFGFMAFCNAFSVEAQLSPITTLHFFCSFKVFYQFACKPNIYD